MAQSRFQQFAVSDSDADSSDNDAASREYPVEEPAVAADGTNQSSLSFRVEGGTSRNVTDGASPQRGTTDGQSIHFESVPPTPIPPAKNGTPRADSNANGSVGHAASAKAATPMANISFHSVSQPPNGEVSAAHSTREAPIAASAPPAADQESHATHVSTPRYALRDGTPRDDGSSGAAAAEAKEGQPPADRKRRKGTRKRSHRKRSKDPSGASDGRSDGRSEGASAPPQGRTGSPAPPPPARVSPRASRAASSRPNTPRTGASGEVISRPVTPSNRAATPATPHSRGAPVVERHVAPLVPGRSSATAATPATARSVKSSFAFEVEPGSADRASAGSPKEQAPTPPRKPASVRSTNAGAPASVRTSSAPQTPKSVASMRSPGTLDFHVQDEDTISFQVGTEASHPRDGRSAPRTQHPQVPSQSALATPRSTYEMDDDGNAVRVEPARIEKQVNPDGTVSWVFIGAHADGKSPGLVRVISAPPKKLSQRAQDIMAARRRAVERNAKKRHTAPKSVHRARQRYNFPPSGYFDEERLKRHAAAAASTGNTEWTTHRYDHQAACQRVLSEEAGADVRWQTEQITRAIQPVQVGGGGSGTIGARCSCVEYASDKEEGLGAMLRSEAALEEGFKRYLNMQPMQLANVELNDIALPHGPDSPASASRRQSMSPSMGGAEPRRNPERGIATLGGLWCTVEALREDGRPAARKEAKAPRRVMRVCGGPALGLPLQKEGETLDVRCYELLLFPQESHSPEAVNYGAEGLTLGQLISPPASSFPLTPRIVEDPIQLKEYKRKLMTSKTRAVTMQNAEDDRLTFFGTGGTASIAAPKGSGSVPGTPSAAAGPGASTTAGPAAAGAGRYLTITLVTLNPRLKYTIDLTLVLLPYRASNVDGGKTLAEVPRFCPITVSTHRRLQGLSLSFSTRSSFMSAYRALLWTTECNIIDIQAPAGGPQSAAAQNGLPYLNLRVSATPSPLLPWSASMGAVDPSTDPHDTFHGNCVDFAVITLAASPSLTNESEAGYRDPLTLDDFVIEEYTGGPEDDENADDDADAKSRQVIRRRSSIYTNTLVPQSERADEGVGAGAVGGTTVVGLTAFGVIRRAVNQKTSEVFDVRVIPRNRARMCPAFDEESKTIKTVKVEEEQLLQQDVEAAIMMEYTSRLPFQSRVYGVLVDEQRYYVFQEPWISALALEQAAAGSAERNALEYNPALKELSDRTSVMSLKEFIHGVLRPAGVDDDREYVATEEAKLQIAQLLISQLLMLITSIHGKGMLLGPCPPHRLLVRIETPATADGAAGSGDSSPTKAGGGSAAPITSKDVQLCVLDVGLNTYAWSYERQQCGVLEYVAPSYIFEYMLGEDIGKESRAWTTRDDWWSFLCICFELLAGDGSALVKPAEEPIAPTPTPIISKFSSPVDVLNIWRGVLTNQSVSGATAAEAVAARVREFVRGRVLESIAPMLDGWIANKADELEMFGTNRAGVGKRKKGVGRAVPPANAPANSMMGVSLASMYFQNNRDTPSNLSETGGPHFVEEPAEPVENILKEMPWVFHYRELFDSVIDTVYPDAGDLPCAIHAPTIHLLSHPFFSSLSLEKVFDGTQPLPRAAAAMVRGRLSKAKVKSALIAYRQRTYRGPLPKRPEYPLMITGSDFNVGNNNGGAPLLMLTSPAYRDELSARNFDGDDGVPAMGPQEGLVYSPGNSMPPSVVPSPRARSPAAGQGAVPGASQSQPPPQSAAWGYQNRLRSMYKPDELQSIAVLESEVRGALYSHTARDSLTRREMEIPSAGASSAGTPRQQQQQQQQPLQQPQMSITNDNDAPMMYQFPPPSMTAAPPARTASATSSQRHSAHEYERVPSRNSSVLAPPADELHSDRGSARSRHTETAGNRSTPAPYQQTSTAPFVDPTTTGGTGGENTPNRFNTPRGPAGGAGGETVRRRGTPGGGSSRRSYDADFNEIEQSLNALAAGPGGARGSRTNSALSGPPRSTAGSQSGRWPAEFLDTAHLDKKGTPVKLSDPLDAGSNAAGDVAGANGSNHTPRTPHGTNSIRSGGHQPSVIIASEPHRRQTQPRTPQRKQQPGGIEDDESVVLVPSDDDESGVFAPHGGDHSAGAHGRTYNSSAAGRSTPSRKRSVPAWRRGSADSRDAYFEF